MELTSTLIAIIIITSLVSAILSLGAKLVYDGIKAKKNGNGNGGHILMDLALLAKDIDFNNLMLTKIENNTSRLIELSITSKEQSDAHSIDLKTAMYDQTNMFRTLISALTTALARLESKLQ